MPCKPYPSVWPEMNDLRLNGWPFVFLHSSFPGPNTLHAHARQSGFNPRTNQGPGPSGHVRGDNMELKRKGTFPARLIDLIYRRRCVARMCDNLGVSKHRTGCGLVQSKWIMLYVAMVRLIGRETDRCFCRLSMPCTKKSTSGRSPR